MNKLTQRALMALVFFLALGQGPMEATLADSPIMDVDTAVAMKVGPLRDERDKKEAKEIGEALGKKLNFFETENFTWCSSLSKGKMVKIMNEAERCYKIFARDAGYSSHKKLWKDGRKCMGVILANKRDYRRYVKWYSKKYPVWNKEQFVKNHAPGSHLNESAQRNVMVTHLKPHKPEHVAAVMCHLVGHLCVDRHAYNNNFTPGWLRESLGIYFQGKVHGRLVVGSFDDPYGLGTSEDEDKSKGLKLSAFKVIVKKSINKHRLKHTKNMFELATLRELTFFDTQKGHLLISWMLKDKGKFSRFIKECKATWPGVIQMENSTAKVKSQVKALKKVFGVSPEEADKALKAFAKSGY